MINRLHVPASDDVSTNDWAHWEDKAQTEIALITTLSEDWNQEEQMQVLEEQAQIRKKNWPKWDMFRPKCPHIPYIVVG